MFISSQVWGKDHLQMDRRKHVGVMGMFCDCAGGYVPEYNCHHSCNWTSNEPSVNTSVVRIKKKNHVI